jgi:hypothetical protein
MKFPFIIEAYEETQSGDLLIESETVYNPTQADGFIIQHFGKKIKHRIIDIPPIDKNEAISRIIFYLIKPENKDKQHDFYKIASSLNIEKSMADHSYRSMLNSQYFFNTNGSQLKPIVKLTTIGESYAGKLEDEYFGLNNEPLHPKSTYMAMIQDTCEIIFQMHKNPKYQVPWSKSTYDGKPDNLGAAKEMMLRMGIIHNVGKHTTMLEHEVMDANSYEEAKKILEQKNTLPAQNFNFQGGFAGQFNNQSSDNSFKSERTENTKTINAIPQKTKSAKSNVIKTIGAILAIIASLIAIYEFIIKHIFHTQSLF